MLDVLLTPAKMEAKLNHSLDLVIDVLRSQYELANGTYDGVFSATALTKLEAMTTANLKYWLDVKRKAQKPQVQDSELGVKIFLN